MKNLIFIITLLALFYNPSEAQNTLRSADDYARISLNVFIPDQVESIPASSKSLLTSKLTQAATRSGMAGGGPQGRFLLTANMDLLSKNIVAGAPNKHAYEFEVSLYIVDYIDKNIVSSTSFEVKGVGNNEDKVFTSAIRSLNFRNRNIDQFFDEGKRKIIEYFNSNCDFVLARANALASQRQYEDAMNTLSSIPEVSKDCYLEAMRQIGPIYKEFANYNCQILINVARANWAASPNSDGAAQAGAVLSQIDPGSVCYADSRQLIDKMEKKVLKDENRDWKFIEKMYNNEVMLESLRIRAWRDAEVAWGRGQKPTYNDVIWIFR